MADNFGLKIGLEGEKERYPRRQFLTHLLRCFKEGRRAEQAHKEIRYPLPGGYGKTGLLHHAGNLPSPVQESTAQLRAEYLELSYKKTK